MKALCFEDLHFHTHPVDTQGIRAELNFENGFGVSVIQSQAFAYCDSKDEYELALTRGGCVCYTTPIAPGGVVRHCTKEQITALINRVQCFQE